MTNRGFWTHAAPLLFVSISVAAETNPSQGGEAEALPDIQLHTIIEAPVQEVESHVKDATKVEGWLVQRVLTWAPEHEKQFAIVPYGGDEACGVFVKGQEGDLLAMHWPEGSTTTLRIRVHELDAYLTMVSIIHGGWRDATPERSKLYTRAKRQWRHALLRLQMRFPEPLVETWRRRPRSVEGEFVERNLLMNGDFESAGPSAIENVAPGWEINRKDPAPRVHTVDENVFHSGSRSQRISRPPDWSNYAVQQFTPDAPGLIDPGKTYVLTGYAKAVGITNPAGWYKLGLWAARADGTPIADTLKNEQVKDASGKLILNHDWKHFEIKGTAPPGATRAIVILTGHWDEGGMVWYDDLRLWPDMPPPTTAGK